MKITYETHYRSTREDGRHTSSMAAMMARMRNTPAALSMPKGMTSAEFAAWRATLVKKVRELLQAAFWEEEAKGQPAPKLLSAVQREGYRVEKWECYPDAYTALPFLALIPDDASETHPVPAVMCLPGSIFSKEFLAGEPLLDTPNCRFEKYPDRNRMALYMVKNGMAAFAFDSPEIAECSLEIEREGNYGGTSRAQMCHGLLQCGFSYPALSVMQKICALQFIKTLPYVDGERIAVSAHSLGCDPAMYMGLLCDEIKAIVFNDLVCDEYHRYYATTEYDERAMCNNAGNWHVLPGHYVQFARPDVLAALAPKYLALNEGGAQFYIDRVREAYDIMGAADRLQITHYPKYQNEAERSACYEPPKYGLSEEGYFAYTNTDAPDHSFREQPSIALLKKAFGL